MARRGKTKIKAQNALLQEAGELLPNWLQNDSPQTDSPLKASKKWGWVLIAIPLIFMCLIWFSALAFVPVPWPDDSAFYFVAKYLFAWPPRWVMIPQAPFEPTYRIWNFNTMPIYPILIGLGRWIGIDGSFALKFWPLAAWAGSIAWLTYTLYKKGLHFGLALLICMSAMMSPIQRWASVLVRPESLIGFIGVIITLWVSFGIPEKYQAKTVWTKRLWHPIAFLLAFSAYIHFNAVHLLFILIPAILFKPREIIEIGLKTALYMTPWLLSALAFWNIFIQQMKTQFVRLSVGNDWLQTPKRAIDSLLQDMGSPEPWVKELKVAGSLWWVIILIAIAFQLIGSFKVARGWIKPETKDAAQNSLFVKMLASSGWVLGSCWLWNNKPEVWFVYYIHLALTVFGGLALYFLTQEKKEAVILRATLVGLFTAITLISAYANVDQEIKLARSPSWNWKTYNSYIDCIDGYLKEHEAKMGFPKPYRVWDPTYPDTIIELSRRHPDWEFSRTCDFHDRQDLAIQHGKDVEAMIVNETVNFAERFIQGPVVEYPDVKSVWMEWDGYFLNRFHKIPGFKPDRFVCQRGRWVSFIYLKPVDSKGTLSETH